MLSLNRHEVIGHLGTDPELTYTPSNRSLVKLALATNRRWRDKEGRIHDKVQWHRIVVWGQLAEFAAKYLRKGAYVRIVGESQTDEYEDREGIKRWATQLVAKEVDFLQPAPRSGEATDEPAPEAPVDGSPPPPAGGDDIPF